MYREDIDEVSTQGLCFNDASPQVSNSKPPSDCLCRLSTVRNRVSVFY
jgi:hypothetical protein